MCCVSPTAPTTRPSASAPTPMTPWPCYLGDLLTIRRTMAGPTAISLALAVFDSLACRSACNCHWLCSKRTALLAVANHYGGRAAAR